MNEPTWKVRVRWTLADGSEANGLAFIAERRHVASWQVLRHAIAYFAAGPDGPREITSVTLTIEESPRCEPYTSD